MKATATLNFFQNCLAKTPKKLAYSAQEFQKIRPGLFVADLFVVYL